LSMADFTLPEVKATPHVAKFFRKGAHDYVEISFVGTKDNFIQRVQPEHMARFKPEWDAFCDGRPLTRRPGTPLTECPNISEDRAEFYVGRNIHNLEELAALSDAQCQGVGHGVMTDRKNAALLLTHRKHDAREKATKAVQDASAKLKGAPADDTTANEVAALKGDVAEIKTAIAALTEMLMARKPGRPKKQKAAD